jgi:antagonist of KipI
VLEVVAPGLLSTIQDGGRPEAMPLGVPRGGACDPWALAVANLLVGNAADAPAVELTLLGPELAVLRDCVIALGGADLAAVVPEEDRALGVGASHRVRAGTTVRFGAATDGRGIRAYLALARGLDVPRVLGSASTYVAAGIGGLGGGPLAVGDRLVPVRHGPSVADRRWPDGSGPAGVTPADVRELRVVAGPHAHRLADDALERLLASAWEVDPRSDRMAVRLSGPALTTADATEAVSQGVVWGAIQVPSDGQPIALLADHQTVGGYPVVAVVAAVDLGLLGQLGTGDRVRFRLVTVDDAQRAWRARAAALRRAGAILARA